MLESVELSKVRIGLETTRGTNQSQNTDDDRYDAVFRVNPVQVEQQFRRAFACVAGQRADYVINANSPHAAKDMEQAEHHSAPTHISLLRSRLLATRARFLSGVFLLGWWWWGCGRIREAPRISLGASLF